MLSLAMYLKILTVWNEYPTCASHQCPTFHSVYTTDLTQGRPQTKPYLLWFFKRNFQYEKLKRKSGLKQKKREG